MRFSFNISIEILFPYCEIQWFEVYRSVILSKLKYHRSVTVALALTPKRASCPFLVTPCSCPVTTFKVV